MSDPQEQAPGPAAMARSPDTCPSEPKTHFEKSRGDLIENAQWLAENHNNTIHATTSGLPADRESDESHVLRCLGAALAMHWNALPYDIKSDLFESACVIGSGREDIGGAGERLRDVIAEFLQRYSDDGSARG